MRVAWFSPLPPVRSGIAAYSAELLPLLRETFVIDEYPERHAHDFVWRHRRAPYDLVVYQLGNATCHDYMWAYLARYPGLVVLHDAKLHHARARQLLQQGRTDDYRREFFYDHPDAPPDVAEYAVAGLSGSIYYFWPMISVVLRTARRVCFHNAIVAADVREAFPDVRVDTVRMGVPELSAAPDARAKVRDSLNLPADACVFAAFGRVTAEKRVGPILNALAQLVDAGSSAHVMFVGDADTVASTLRPELQARGLDRHVRVTGYVPDAAIADYLAAADACLCLRWPTAQETSASWLRCLAAARPTIITDLAHLADIPDTAALRVDLLDEESSLSAAMRSLADNASRREQIGRAGHAFWRANHTLDIMANDYRRLLPAAAADPAPEPDDLPAHFVADHSETANAIADRFQVSIDILRQSSRS
jgi:glycosyltransferase involved in cell wall biosynthesis